MRIRANKNLLIVCIPTLLAVGSFLLANTAHAAFEWAGDILIGILSFVISALGLVLVLVIQGLTLIASWQLFIKADAVMLGWIIVRDICNMFFVVVLMIIAFGTILNIPDYSYKKWLPKLVLFAILINFSKTICGLLIDVSQVVMLTFVNAFKDIGGANLTQVLGITDILTISQTSDGVSQWIIIGAYFLGLIYMLVAIVVISTMIMVLAMRVVMIWIYVVLSPAAYLLAAFPGGQKYSSQWWSEFIKNLIVGPVLAFFVWLSLASLTAEATVKSFQNSAADGNAASDISRVTGGGSMAVAGVEASTPSALIKYVIGIGMLVGGLMVSQQIGGAAGGLAGKGMSRLQKGAAFAGGMATGAALLPLKGVKSATSYGVDKLHQKTGVDLNLKRSWATVQAKRKEIQAKRYAEGQVTAGKVMAEGGRLHGMLAMTGNSGDAWEQMTSVKGIKKRLKGGRQMSSNVEAANNEKDQINNEVKQMEFEREWMSSSATERSAKQQEIQTSRSDVAQKIYAERAEIASLDQNINIENAKGDDLKDNDKIKAWEQEKLSRQQNISNLQKEGNALQNKRKFIEEKDANGNYVNGINKTYSDNEIWAKDAAIRDKKDDGLRVDRRLADNVPDYNFEARAAEQSLVSKEMSKIKDIDDADELGRILEGALESRDKTLIKAITLKMAKDGNDNEYLKKFAGRTDHKGLKTFMRQLIDKSGFSEQEAFGLGSQIAEINKGTNHWGATAAYTMENGKFRETTDEEHNHIRDIETGKQQLQAFIRNNNRLAYGYHDENGDFHLDEGGIMKLMAIDNKDGHKNMETMNESAAKHIYDAIMAGQKTNSKLYQHFSRSNVGQGGKSLVEVLEQRLGNIKDKKFDEKLQTAKDLAA